MERNEFFEKKLKKKFFEKNENFAKNRKKKAKKQFFNFFL